MEPRPYLDTHVALWLYEPTPEMLSRTARDSLERADPRISPMVTLELELLHEIGRSRVSAAEVISSLAATIGLTVCDLDFRRVIDAAVECVWTRDPFDRVIVAHARAGGGRLLTRDANIRRNAPEAIW